MATWRCVTKLSCSAYCNMGQLMSDKLEADKLLGCRFLPYVGQVTIIMNDYPYLKYALIGVLALFVITSKE